MRTFRDLLYGCAIAGSMFTSGLANAETDSVDTAFFETHVRPLLVERCYECHSSEAGESMGELRLDSQPAMLRGGSHGPAVVAGKPDESVLIRAVRHDDVDMQMPPDGKLPDAEIALLERWIAGGAIDPRVVDTTTEMPATVSPLQRDIASHWAFVVPKRIDATVWESLPTSPESNSLESNDQDAIDAVASRLASAEQLSNATSADDITLNRRLRNDLQGMPSSFAETQSIQQRTGADASPRPDEKMRRINRMLADPSYGERFGRHWLDVARYSDTKGYALGGQSRDFVGAFRYRDWVIDAFATDMPYDEMIRHQLAGDRTDPENKNGNADAMGFLTVGRHFLSHHDTIDDRIDVVGRGLLGLTIACARCHDHKFDPIPTADYYSLYSVFENSVPPPDLNVAVSPLMLIDREPLHPIQIFQRGNPANRGDVAPRQYLTAFRDQDAPEFPTGSGRFDLADRIASADNPLTARVMVNRVWDQLMGRGLVDSASDFGFQIDAPDLQIVLDELAAEFATHWSVQRLVRRIVHSRMYQQSSIIDDRSRQIDPDNRLWTHANRKRRDFESMRDAILVGCDHCDHQIGGTSVSIIEPALTPRRTIYGRIDRQDLAGVFRTFDFANPDMHSPGRYYTTVPQQSLFLMNHPQMIAAAARVAKIVLTEIPESIDEESQADQRTVENLFRSILGRSPSASETTDAITFLRSPTQSFSPIPDARSIWSYGSGPWVNDQLESFERLDTFANNQWQFGPEFPSADVHGYANLSKVGGHAPRGDLAVVRRWTSPLDGEIRINAKIGHAEERGDGVTVIIRIGDDRVVRESVHSAQRSIPEMVAKVRLGQTIDFIVIKGETDSFDSFTWQSNITVTGDDGRSVVADSSGDFSGPVDSQTIRSLDRVGQLAQILFLSNEFLFVD